MARYRKPRKQVDLSQLKPDSKEYWEEILKRENLSMTRGMYPSRLSYGWEYRDNDPRSASENPPANTIPQPLGGPARPEADKGSPESKESSDTFGVHEDGYTEDSKP